MEETKRYKIYKQYLKKYKPYYNNFYLADILVWFNKNRIINAEEIKNRWEKYLKNGSVGPLNFYVHIPFCESRCSYCMYYSRTANEFNIDRYIDNLLMQANFFSKTFKGRNFSSLYFGGGTPSILNERQMFKLLSGIFKCFGFEKGSERAFECNPKSITVEKMKILKKFGFNRVSFGVQNFDKDVLRYAGREGQRHELIKTVIKNAKKNDFEVNADLMVGIFGDSAKKVQESFKILAKLDPDTITLYSLKPSYEYLRKFYENNNEKFLKELDKKAEEVRKYIKKNKNSLGYFTQDTENEIFTSADPTFFNKKFKQAYEYSYDYTAPLSFISPCSLFALGTSGTSYIFNSLQYHIMEGVKDENKFDKLGGNYWSMDFNLKDEMVYFILQNFANKKALILKEFENFFRKKFEDVFINEIEQLKKIKKIVIKKGKASLPVDPLERYTCALFFLDQKKVDRKIGCKYQK